MIDEIKRLEAAMTKKSAEYDRIWPLYGEA